MKKLIALLLALVMVFAMAACTNNGTENPNGTTGTTEGTTGTTEGTIGNENVLGEGATMFYFTVVDVEGNETKYEIHTDEDTVGAALLALELIAGDPGDYGLYVKTVNGITLDWDKDGKYWGFYVDGEYAQLGVDTTEITAGATYTFKVE